MQDEPEKEEESFKDALDQLEQDVESKNSKEEAKEEEGVPAKAQGQDEVTEKTVDNQDIKSNADIDSKDQETQLNDGLNDEKESLGKLGEVGTDDEFLKQTLSPQNI